MLLKTILLAGVLALTGCVTKEITIIEELDAAGCNIKRFETVVSNRKNTIIVVCRGE